MTILRVGTKYRALSLCFSFFFLTLNVLSSAVNACCSSSKDITGWLPFQLIDRGGLIRAPLQFQSSRDLSGQ